MNIEEAIRTIENRGAIHRMFDAAIFLAAFARERLAEDEAVREAVEWCLKGRPRMLTIRVISDGTFEGVMLDDDSGPLLHDKWVCNRPKWIAEANTPNAAIGAARAKMENDQ